MNTKDISKPLNLTEASLMRELIMRSLYEEAKDYLVHEISILENDLPKTKGVEMQIAELKHQLKADEIEVIQAVAIEGNMNEPMTKLASFAYSKGWI